MAVVKFRKILKGEWHRIPPNVMLNLFQHPTC